MIIFGIRYFMSQVSIPTLLNSYSKLILAIMNDTDEDPLWRRFYQIQMTEYFLSKKDFKFEIEEAQDTYNLIVKTWTDLKKYIDKPTLPINNLDNIFKTVSISFPIDKLTISDTDNNDFLIYGSF